MEERGLAPKGCAGSALPEMSLPVPQASLTVYVLGSQPTIALAVHDMDVILSIGQSPFLSTLKK